MIHRLILEFIIHIVAIFTIPITLLRLFTVILVKINNWSMETINRIIDKDK
jgi:hypothetical protein